MLMLAVKHFMRLNLTDIDVLLYNSRAHDKGHLIMSVTCTT